MATTPKTLLLFVDGLGLGSDDPESNPLFSGVCPVLQKLLEEDAIPIDAQLGVDGLPQSATGQAALLTGVNAAELMGRHIEGLPGPRLKELIRERNLFSELITRGYTATFANAYFIDDLDEIVSRRHQSVTTVASLEAFGRVRDTEKLMQNRAVYQDLTREYLKERGYTGPTITPHESGEHLLDIARRYDFTLFEYFQTDLKAHKGPVDQIAGVLRALNAFVEVLLRFAEEEGHLFVLTSDHGNIEDATTRRHTKNPVPFVALGSGSALLREQMTSLLDFVPSLLEFYPERS